MVKWVLAFVVLLSALGIVIWQLGSKNEAEIVVPDRLLAKQSMEPTATPTTFPKHKQKITTSGPSPDVKEGHNNQILDPTSDAFSDQIDVGIPDGFRARLASCERQDMDPDAKISLSYKLHIENGVVSASNVKIEKSDLNNQDLEQCMVVAIQNARWEASDMPDFSEEQDLFIRIRSLDKYLSEKEQLRAKAQNKIGDDTDTDLEE